MSTPVLIGILVAVVVVIAFFVMRGKGGEQLPPETKPEPTPEPKPAPRPAEERKAEAEKAEAPAVEKADAPAAEEAEAPAEPAEEAPAEEAAEAAEEEAAPAPAEEPAAAAEPEAEAPAAPAPRQKASPEDVAALKKGLKGTRGGFIAKLSRLFGKKKELEPGAIDEMEEVLITADIGVKTADELLTRLRAAVEDGTITTTDQAWSAIQAYAEDVLTRHGAGPIVPVKKPTVILVVGVNGVGKTTTIGKLASMYKEQGKEVLLAAGDTFRAAAVMQLEVWGRRTGCDVVKGKDRADPGSVIFDAVKKGVEIGADVVICDTAGRLHTKTPLMEELKKVGRTAEKALGRPADEVLLVLDATTGQNAIQQAELFKDALEVSGIALTKLDGTAKGGVILGIVDQHRVPVRYVGIGERVEDLREFQPGSFVEALFERPDEEEAAAS
ncbi:MAG TPA: signal recognition particle-docking protein FtsY [Polyangiaceae bacterium LLY-WYZ-15_(1-7)]|nr:signal recognition particle-docking protein FtsY [Sandaracinus sp.]HJL02882.1 signal recognition particle-docking protein FtsY [Polyangiaceae bacterium LLY-WYZ-15_(1-7)]MBJ74243.1 signal recognition particle-docking protein FtsY [Sandaracinus sp.]HJL07484.1 signal recognition particle-docking protein FtsY [Polyangiaceae bacterium LLY-WYZ-15_(1-7)]HJL35018.1 signal recognition particle-docking protein FtsY [Polyangiaceae bacterium LLY-WYZ-15_(1-7)]